MSENVFLAYSKNKKEWWKIMALNVKCPKCGSTEVQLSSVSSKHGCLWFILLGWVYLITIPIKWIIGLAVLCFVDWWMAIIKKKQGKGYIWKSKRWFSGKKKVYYCHSCGHNFKG